MLTSKKASVRQKIIFILMVISVVWFVIDYNLIYTKPAVKVNSNELNVNSLLIDTARFLVVNPKYARVVDQKMPSEIFLFLEGYAENTQANKEVIIFEIVDQVEKQEKIARIISAGDQLLKEDKLTSPVGSNAFERYESVLAIDSNNEDAIAGIQKIVNRYLSLADLVIRKNEAYKVAGLVENAYKVSADYFDISSQVKKYAPYMKDESIFLGQSSGDGNDNDSVNYAVANLGDETTDGETIKVIDNRSKYSKSNTKDVDRKTAYIAKKLTDQGNIDGAIKVLESFTLLSDYWVDSYDLLLGLYLKAEMNKEAEALVYNNKSLDLFQFAEKAAHIFVARDDAAGAIRLLEGHQPAIEDYQNYYSLKAGLFYEAGNYGESSTLYRKLLHVDYTNPIYWLGLAVSLDKLEDGKALQAFHYANYYSDQKSDVKRYIEKNIILVASY
jgi:hypothetical protein